jgi:CRISPR-associated protein Cas2
MRRRILVSYDISDPKRLRRVHRIVRDFGDAVQLSVFVCQLSAKDLAVLEARLLDAIHQRQDQVLMVDLGRIGDDGSNSAIIPGCRTLGRVIVPGSVRTIIV